MKKPIDIRKTDTFDKKLISEFKGTNRDLHAYNIEYFMSNPNEAMVLALENLINTYGIESLNIGIEQLNERLQSAKKVS